RRRLARCPRGAVAPVGEPRRPEPRVLAPLLPEPEVSLPRPAQGRRGGGLLPRGQQVTSDLHPRRGGRGHLQPARPPPLRAGERAARGQLKVKDLPEGWNSRFKSYLGLDVPNDRGGAIQDIHWSFVSFGLF